MSSATSFCIICDKELANLKFSLTQRKKKPNKKRKCKDCVTEINWEHSTYDFETEFSKTINPFRLLSPFDIIYVNFNEARNGLCDLFIDQLSRKYSLIIPLGLCKLICAFYHNNTKDEEFMFLGHRYLCWGKTLVWVSDKRKEYFNINIPQIIDQTMCVPFGIFGIKFKILDISRNAWQIRLRKLAKTKDANTEFHALSYDSFNDKTIEENDKITYMFNFNKSELVIWLNEDIILQTLTIENKGKYAFYVNLYDRIDAMTICRSMTICNSIQKMYFTV
eukprot:69181_1